MQRRIEMYQLCICSFIGLNKLDFIWTKGSVTREAFFFLEAISW